jgi:hypothetical protein
VSTGLIVGHLTRLLINPLRTIQGDKPMPDYTVTLESNNMEVASIPCKSEIIKKLITAIEIVDSQDPVDNDDIEYLHSTIIEARRFLKYN